MERMIGNRFSRPKIRSRISEVTPGHSCGRAYLILAGTNASRPASSLCQHICWRTRRQIGCAPHGRATVFIPAFAERRTRSRMPQGSPKESPTATRRTERGLDPSACASATTPPTIAGMSLPVRQANEVTTKLKLTLTLTSMPTGTIHAQSTSIPKDACIAQSACSPHFNSRRKPLLTRCLTAREDATTPAQGAGTKHISEDTFSRGGRM